jgi:hypothetical protein
MGDEEASRTRAKRPYRLGDDSRATCWLCDRERGELCHIHERLDTPDSEGQPEPDVAWSTPASKRS